MKRISFAEFDSVYLSSLDEIWPHWNVEMQTEIARHCTAWAPGRTDFYDYLRVSSIRFYKAYQALPFDGATLCDVGGFWGVWPVTAKKLGFDVAMTETLKYYGGSFRPLFEHLAKNGVEICDYDPFSPDAALPRRFDLVTVMAVLEHYPHSLKTLFENLKKITAPGGRLYLEVPNIAYWPKRTALLRGETPLSAIADVYASDVPFIGHHHEFTPAEMNELARLAGLRVVSQDLYNYTLSGANPLKLMLRHPIMSLAFSLAPKTRECIAIVCETARLETSAVIS